MRAGEAHCGAGRRQTQEIITGGDGDGSISIVEVDEGRSDQCCKQRTSTDHLYGSRCRDTDGSGMSSEQNFDFPGSQAWNYLRITLKDNILSSRRTVSPYDARPFTFCSIRCIWSLQNVCHAKVVLNKSIVPEECICFRLKVGRPTV